MAWTAPVTTFASGNVLTAAQMNAIGDNLLASGPIYTTEVARDAAITSPFEGQRAYITTPNIAAYTSAGVAATNATGNTTVIPGGLLTFYNGTSWVSTNEVGAVTNAQGTTTSTTFTATLSGSPGTNPSVTLVTGTTALVTMTAVLANDTTSAGAYMGVAVSGATTQAANNNTALYNGGTGGQYFLASSTVLYTGLTAGTNVFTLQYHVGASGIGTFNTRQLIVKGLA
jgi:hypothetical protein